MTKTSGTKFAQDVKDDELSEKGGDDVVCPICEEEEPLERNLNLDNKQMEVAENDSDHKLKHDEATGPVNPLSSNAAQTLVLKNLQHHNKILRESFIDLVQHFVSSAEAINAIVKTESQQIATVTELSSAIHFLEQRMEKLKEEVDKQRNANAQLEELISRLTKSSEP